MAGFSTRLREKIESTRFNAAGGHVSSNQQPKNIRGLTRLGTGAGTAVSPSVGLLSGRINSSSGSPGTSTSIAPLPVQTSSLRKESGQEASYVVRSPRIIGGRALTSAVGLDSNSTLLGGSKIVPGWVSGSSNDTINAPSGHLGSINLRDRAGQKETQKYLGNELTRQSDSPRSKRVPWALHQPAPLPSMLSHISLSRRRWGDEDDSDDEFPQIRSDTGKGDEVQEEAVSSSNSSQQNDKFPGIGGQPNDLHGSYTGDYKEEICPDETENNPMGNFHKVNGHCDDDCDDHNQGDNKRVSAKQCSHPKDECTSQQSRTCDNGQDCISKENKELTNETNVEPYGLDRGSAAGRGNFDNRMRKRWDEKSGKVSHYSSRSNYNGSLFGPTQSTARMYCKDRSMSWKDSSNTHTSGLCRYDRKLRHLQNQSYGGAEGAVRDVGHDQDRHGFSPKWNQQGQEASPSKGTAGFSLRNRMNHHLSRDPISLEQRGLSDSMVVKGGDPSDQSLLGQKFTREQVPLVLLRSCDSDQIISMKAESSLGSADERRETIQSAPPTTTWQSDSGKNIDRLAQPPQLWSTARTTMDSKFSSGVAPNSERDKGEELVCSSNVCESPVRTPGDVDQERKVRAKEQQQNVLRQVVERRAAYAAASSRGEHQAGKVNGAQWERGLKLITDVVKREGSAFNEKAPDEHQTEVHCPDSREVSGDYRTKSPRKHSDRSEIHSRPHAGWRNRNSNECGIELSGPRPLTFPKAGESKLKARSERANPCRIEGHGHDWNDCPHNPKSESFIRNNPCRIEGHDHDWIDCVDNPKSENYVKPIKKGRRAIKHPSTRTNGERKQTSALRSITEELRNDSSQPVDGGLLLLMDRSDRAMGQSRLEEEEIERNGDDLKLASQSSKVLSEPLDMRVKLPVVRPFVPAPPPAVSAWISGPPPTIAQGPPSQNPLHHKPSDSKKSCDANHVAKNVATHGNQTFHDLEEQQLSDSEKAGSTVLPMPVSSLQGVETCCKMQERPQHPILPSNGVLFPGNDALFGETQSSTPVYSSWNPPPIILPNISVDPWKPNPFSPVSLSTSSGEWFGSIWSDNAISLVSSQSNSGSGDGCVFSSSPSLIFTPMQSQASMGVVAPVFAIGDLPNNDYGNKKFEHPRESFNRKNFMTGDSLHMDEHTNHTENVSPLRVKSVGINHQRFKSLDSCHHPNRGEGEGKVLDEGTPLRNKQHKPNLMRFDTDCSNSAAKKMPPLLNHKKRGTRLKKSAKSVGQS